MSDLSEYVATLLGIRGDLGEIKGTLRAMNERLAEHIADDAALTQRVGEMEEKLAEARGARRVYSSIVTILGTLGGVIGGFAADFLWKHG